MRFPWWLSATLSGTAFFILRLPISWLLQHVWPSYANAAWFSQEKLAIVHLLAFLCATSLNGLISSGHKRRSFIAFLIISGIIYVLFSGLPPEYIVAELLLVTGVLYLSSRL